MVSLASLRPRFEAVLAGYPEKVLYGFSDLGRFLPSAFADTPRALSLAVRMPEALMDSVKNGPTPPYYAEYNRVNALIDNLSAALAAEMEKAGFAARFIPASGAYDRQSLLAELPHKTGAVQAGLGWIGRNCQLVTRAFGPRVRLGTVLTDMPLGEESRAVTRSFCGGCTACVEVCPVRALSGSLWAPGMPRDELFDARACSDWKAAHYAEFNGSVCGICTAVCPMGTERARERRRKVPVL